MITISCVDKRYHMLTLPNDHDKTNQAAYLLIKNDIDYKVSEEGFQTTCIRVRSDHYKKARQILENDEVYDHRLAVERIFDISEAKNT